MSARPAVVQEGLDASRAGGLDASRAGGLDGRCPDVEVNVQARVGAVGTAGASPGRTRPAAPYPRDLDPARLRAQRLERGWQCELTARQQRAKRTLDLTLCVLLIPLAALLVGVAAAAVRWESPGPVFFTQERVGTHGRRFRMWKLRTMVVNAAALEQQLQHLNELPWPDFKISRDPRVTRVGRLLRRTSLDELPQLWNVVRGEMSLVGPRPTNFGVADYQLWHTERQAAPPGITGLWQVLERAQCDFDQRLRLDLAYVRAWRLGLDVRLLLATIKAVVGGRGAV
ncbi:MAG TPA: sugar transferase [Terriglobales bacterium]|nr:sugar transferase [Terriglobales bacterium]